MRDHGVSATHARMDRRPIAGAFHTGTTRAHAWFVWRAACVLVLAVAILPMVAGCMRDPLDPRGALDHRAVSEIARAEARARSRLAYERARRRVVNVKRGMSAGEVEVAMEALVVAQQGDEDDGEESPRVKLVEGRICINALSALRSRWVFGYDEAGVELVGFAIEFERDDPEDDDWVVRRIDEEPDDECESVEAE